MKAGGGQWAVGDQFTIGGGTNDAIGTVVTTVAPTFYTSIVNILQGGNMGAVIGVDLVNNTYTVDGDISIYLAVGVGFLILDSTANNNEYVTQSWDSSSGDTVITVIAPIPDPTVDGYLQVGPIVVIAGTHAADFSDNATPLYVWNTGNDNSYNAQAAIDQDDLSTMVYLEMNTIFQNTSLDGGIAGVKSTATSVALVSGGTEYGVGTQVPTTAVSTGNVEGYGITVDVLSVVPATGTAQVDVFYTTVTAM
jgi:hypothetical protein